MEMEVKERTITEGEGRREGGKEGGKKEGREGRRKGEKTYMRKIFKSSHEGLKMIQTSHLRREREGEKGGKEGEEEEIGGSTE